MLRWAITGAGSSVPLGTGVAQRNETASPGLHVIHCLSTSNLFIVSNSLASTAVEDFSFNLCQVSLPGWRGEREFGGD